MFGQIGLCQWFRYATAAVEVAGAVLLLVPGLAAPGALLPAVTMASAVLAHLAILHTIPGGAVVLFAPSTVVIWLRRSPLGAFGTASPRT